MRPTKRMAVNKGRSAKTFKNNVRTTKTPNIAPPPMRGGYRM